MVCLIPSAWHDSSTMNTTVEESCQRKKKKLSRLLNNRVSDCWRTVPATVEESCKLTQKHKMEVWYNANIASTLDLRINYYVQYQFHKVLPLVLTKADRGVSRGTAHPTTSHFFFSFLTCYKCPFIKHSFGYDLLIWERYFDRVWKLEISKFSES